MARESLAPGVKLACLKAMLDMGVINNDASIREVTTRVVSDVGDEDLEWRIRNFVNNTCVAIRQGRTMRSLQGNQFYEDLVSAAANSPKTATATGTPTSRTPTRPLVRKPSASSAPVVKRAKTVFPTPSNIIANYTGNSTSPVISARRSSRPRRSPIRVYTPRCTPTIVRGPRKIKVHPFQAYRPLVGSPTNKKVREFKRIALGAAKEREQREQREGPGRARLTGNVTPVVVHTVKRGRLSKEVIPVLNSFARRNNVPVSKTVTAPIASGLSDNAIKKLEKKMESLIEKKVEKLFAERLVPQVQKIIDDAFRARDEPAAEAAPEQLFQVENEAEEAPSVVDAATPSDNAMSLLSVRLDQMNEALLENQERMISRVENVMRFVEMRNKAWSCIGGNGSTGHAVQGAQPQQLQESLPMVEQKPTIPHADKFTGAGKTSVSAIEHAV